MTQRIQACKKRNATVRPELVEGRIHQPPSNLKSILTALLTLALAFPPAPAFALRGQEPAQTGLEEKLRKALRSPGDLVSAVSAALGLNPPAPAAGLEEVKITPDVNLDQLLAGGGTLTHSLHPDMEFVIDQEKPFGKMMAGGTEVDAVNVTIYRVDASGQRTAVGFRSIVKAAKEIKPAFSASENLLGFTYRPPAGASDLLHPSGLTIGGEQSAGPGHFVGNPSGPEASAPPESGPPGDAGGLGLEEEGIGSLLVVEGDPINLQTWLNTAQSWRKDIRVTGIYRLPRSWEAFTRDQPFDALVIRVEPGNLEAVREFIQTQVNPAGRQKTVPIALSFSQLREGEDWESLRAYGVEAFVGGTGQVGELGVLGTLTRLDEAFLRLSAAGLEEYDDSDLTGTEQVRGRIRAVLKKYPNLEFQVLRLLDGAGNPLWGREVRIWNPAALREDRREMIVIFLRKYPSDDERYYRLSLFEIRKPAPNSVEYLSFPVDFKRVDDPAKLLPALRRFLNTAEIQQLLAQHNSAAGPATEPSAGGLEEGWIEKAVAVVEGYMAHPDIASVVPLLRDPGWPLDVTGSFPALRGVLQGRGVALERVYRIPPAFLRSVVRPSWRPRVVYLDPTAAWAEAVRNRLEGAVDEEGQQLIEVVTDLERAQVVVADSDMRSAPQKQILVRVQPGDVQRVIALVTPALFAHLERSGLLRPGAVVYLYQGEPDKDVYLFA